MSGIGKTGGPDLGLLERLSQAPSGTIKVDETGKRFTMDTSMTFRSGIHRMLQQGKSNDDVQQNRATLNSLLDEIREKAGESVYQKVLNSELKLSGDRGTFTVGDRLERGTYVSNKLVAELLQIARGAIAEENEQMRPLEEQSRQKIDTLLSKPSTPLNQEDRRSVDRKGILEDEHTWGQFKQYVSDNRDRIRSSFDEEVRTKARNGQVLDNFDIDQHVSKFVGRTLLPEFIDAQPDRKHFKDMTNDDIAEGARRHFEQEGLTNKFGDHVDTVIHYIQKGGREVEELRQGVEQKLEGRGMLSMDELVKELNPRKLNDLLSLQIRQGLKFDDE
jgi:hypothetical protein